MTRGDFGDVEFGEAGEHQIGEAVHGKHDIEPALAEFPQVPARRLSERDVVEAFAALTGKADHAERNVDAGDAAHAGGKRMAEPPGSAAERQQAGMAAVSLQIERRKPD